MILINHCYLSKKVDQAMKAERLTTSHVKQAPHYLATRLEKRKQKKVIHAQLKKINRMKKALEKKKAGKKKRSLEDALGELPENFAHFIRMQLNLHRKKAKGRRYSPQMKLIAVSLYHASEKAYWMLSKLFTLPTKASLRKYISNMPYG